MRYAQQCTVHRKKGPSSECTLRKLADDLEQLTLNLLIVIRTTFSFSRQRGEYFTTPSYVFSAKVVTFQCPMTTLIGKLGSYRRNAKRLWNEIIGYRFMIEATSPEREQLLNCAVRSKYELRASPREIQDGGEARSMPCKQIGM